MICPKYKSALLNQPDSDERIKDGDAECDEKICAQWDEKHGCCCIKTLSELKITGGVNTHSY